MYSEYKLSSSSIYLAIFFMKSIILSSIASVQFQSRQLMFYAALLIPWIIRKISATPADVLHSKH